LGTDRKKNATSEAGRKPQTNYRGRSSEGKEQKSLPEERETWGRGAKKGGGRALQGKGKEERLKGDKRERGVNLGKNIKP